MSAEWISGSKVIARTGQAEGKGDVILKTKSGGVGTCTVQFKCIKFIPGKFHDINYSTVSYLFWLFYRLGTICSETPPA